MSERRSEGEAKETQKKERKKEEGKGKPHEEVSLKKEKKEEQKPPEDKEKKIQLHQLAKKLGLTPKKLRSFFISKKVNIPEKNYTFMRLTPEQVEMAQEVFIKSRIIMGRPFRAREEQVEKRERREFTGQKVVQKERPPPPIRQEEQIKEKKILSEEPRKFGPRVAAPFPPPRRREKPVEEKRGAFPQEPTVEVEVPSPQKAVPKRRTDEKREISRDEQRVLRAQKRLLKQRKEEWSEEEDYINEEEPTIFIRPAPSVVEKEEKPEEKPKVIKEFKRPEVVELKPPVSVRDLSAAIGVKAGDIILSLMREGLKFSINDNLPDEKAVEVAQKFGVKLSLKREASVEEKLSRLEEEVAGENLKPRPPIVTFLGHVDHGKTSLLDYIRKSNVHEKEAGGITQHISAYKVKTSYGEVSFIDTPGHEAFTTLRMRGAQVTDMVVLVVAADDGVMPQTEEAISHAKAAEVPIIVALNKIDKPNADRLRTKQQLSKLGLMPEEWGGDTVVVECSALTGEGVDNLLEMLFIVAEMLELRADPSRAASGYVIEANLTEGVGVIATLLVRDGTLKIGDVVLCGTQVGRVRAIYSTEGELLREAPPATPVQVTGLSEVPEAGEKFYVIEDVQKARQMALELAERSKKAGPASHTTLENIYALIKQQKVKELRIILKADAGGSLEAIQKILLPMSTEEVRIRILHTGIGNVSESDVLLADASDAVVVAFNVG
ncbi:MAG: translation initiation factor IF-2, partial [Planctomycetota bacterium]|nr:translation initiation factor IF-2 [Planctomycetota bacterium]